MRTEYASYLITGGTGSFGNAFVRHALKKLSPKRLVIYSRDEQKQWHMAQEHESSALRFFIGDVRDEDRLITAMRGIDYVIHAAALKIIPTAEYNPTEAVATNILGTQNVCSAALKTGVKKVVMLSTDKAANPCTLYGSTKLCAEKIVGAYNALSGNAPTSYVAVRYGNIALSRGSVIPLFMRQKARHQALTITSEQMTRFWYTLGSAVDLVLNAIEHLNRGEILIPKMPSFRVIDLAEAIDSGGPRSLIGTRGVEKIHEDIISYCEARVPFDGGYLITPPGSRFIDSSEIGTNISSGSNQHFMDVAELRDAIRKATAENA